MVTRPPRIVWVGLAVVLAAAAVLSFDALRALAVAVAIPGHLAWLLPIAVDAGAAVSCATWLGGRTTPDAARFAGRMTWALLAVTVLGNAGQLGMHAHGVIPPWWVAVAVGSIPPAVVGATVHLVVLLVRRGPVEQVGPATEHAELTEPEHVPDEPEHTEHRGDDEPEHVPDVVPAVPARRGTDDEIVQHLREHGLPSRRQLNKVLVCGTDRYDRLLAVAREPNLRSVL